MSIKKIVLNCSCDTEICHHLHEQISAMLQDGYDEGYDEGWTDAWSAIREGLAEMGYKNAKDIRIRPLPHVRRPEIKRVRQVRTRARSSTNAFAR